MFAGCFISVTKFNVNERVNGEVSTYSLQINRWVGRVACMKEKALHTRFWWESRKKRDHYEELDVHGKRVLKLMLNKYDGMVWTGLIWLKIGISGGLLLTR
jgi:hypothetical protein